MMYFWWTMLAIAVVAVWFIVGWIEEHLPMNDHQQYDDRE